MTQESIPHPSALIESMRSIGYRPHTALADLVDNSVTAKASLVQIELSPSDSQGTGWIRIDDNGDGMDPKELLEAMRWGGTGPLVRRKSNDLGRFGLGLKTASFSMGRRLTVVSTKNGVTTALRWDLDHICSTGKWQLLEGLWDPVDEPFFGACAKLRVGRNGTTGTNYQP